MVMTCWATWGLTLCHWPPALSPRNVNEAATLSASGPLSILLSLSPDHTAWPAVRQTLSRTIRLRPAAATNNGRSVVSLACKREAADRKVAVAGTEMEGRVVPSEPRLTNCQTLPSQTRQGSSERDEEMWTAHAFCNASVTRNLQVTITSVSLHYKGCVSGWWAGPGWLSFACRGWWNSTWKENPHASCWTAKRCLADTWAGKKNITATLAKIVFSILPVKHFAFPVNLLNATSSAIPASSLRVPGLIFP